LLYAKCPTCPGCHDLLTIPLTVSAIMRGRRGLAVNPQDPRRADARGCGAYVVSDGNTQDRHGGTRRRGGFFRWWRTSEAPRSVRDSLDRSRLTRLRAEIQPDSDLGFGWRAIRGSTSVPTNHSSGTATDADSKFNWLGHADGGDVPRWLVEMFNRYGFRWGGDYSGRKDPMHWEFMGAVEDARTLTERARAEFGEDDLTPEEKATLKRLKTFP
jgi:D-alanyl-D-alanine carboxypeptidase